MHIAGSASVSQMMQTLKTSEKSEGAGPDHDGDGDEAGVSAPSAKSVTPPGVGGLVDVSA